MNKIKNTLFSNKPVTIDENSLILALESSCDETACAIVKGGREVLANVVASLFALTAILNALVEFIFSHNKNKFIQKVIAATLIIIGVILVNG